MIVKIKRQLKNCLQKRTLQECSRDGIGTIAKTRNLKMIEHKQDNTLRNDECKENRVLSSRLLSIKQLERLKQPLFFIAITFLLHFSGNLIPVDTNQQIKFFWYLLGVLPLALINSQSDHYHFL